MTGPTSSMVRVDGMRRWEGDLYGRWTRGRKARLGRVQKEGEYPPIPPLLGGSNGGDGKARDQEYKTWDRSRLTLSVVGLCSKMADSLPVLPDDLPVLPDNMLLIIAREYRLAAVEDRDCNGWWQVRQEVRYLPRCPKRKRIMNLKGFFIPRFGNLLEPVAGYF